MLTRGDSAASNDIPPSAPCDADRGVIRDTRRAQYPGKRLLDLAVVSLAAIPALALGAICAAAILMEDGSPVLFRQARVGRDGRPFVLFKLRTMTGIQRRGDAFPEPARITRIGRLLRRMSIDELPQLINVLRGEMSLVGPRPTLAYQVRRYDPRQLRRLRVRPGLTGLAQVNGRNRMSWTERIEWDLRYVENQSLRLDLAVIVRTAWAVLSGDGVAGHARFDSIAQAEERRSVVPAVTPRTFCTGTAALAAMLLAEDIGPGDEVIIPSMTFVSTATCVVHVGATPVFADIDPRSFNLDPGEIARLVTSRTRAVMAVHYAGQPGELDQMQKICADHGLLLLEDAAQAAGAQFRGRPVGTFGKSAMFSFTPTKNITTGEGGMVLTGDAATAERLRLLRNHGQARRYEHVLLGYNWRLTELQAAIGRVQLRKLDAILARKRENAAWLSRRLAQVPGISPPHQVRHASSPHMLYTCLVQRNRDAVLGHLLRRGIEARIYFPPAHLQPIFTGRPARLPVTEAVAAQMLSIPMHSQLTSGELAQIGDAVQEAADGAGLAGPPSRIATDSRSAHTGSEPATMPRPAR